MKKKTITIQQKIRIEYDDEKALKEALADIRKYGANWSSSGCGEYRMEKLKTIKIVTP